MTHGFRLNAGLFGCREPVSPSITQHSQSAGCWRCIVYWSAGCHDDAPDPGGLKVQ